jgi:hypothetical protein
MLAPFYDGYAINTARRWEGGVEGVKSEFAGERVITERLAEAPGSLLFQVNVFCNRRDRALHSWEGLSPESWAFFQGRLARTRRAVRQHKARTLAQSEAPPPEVNLAFFRRLLGWRAGGEGSYANPDVKAHLLARLAPGVMLIRCAAGFPNEGHSREERA